MAARQAADALERAARVRGWTGNTMRDVALDPRRCAARTRAERLAVVHVARPVQREHGVAARLEPERGRGRRRRRRARGSAKQRVDHHVADEVDRGSRRRPRGAGSRSPRGSVVNSRSRDRSVEHAVDLLGHGAVEAAQAGLDVGHAGCRSLTATSAPASVELTSPTTSTRSGRSSSRDAARGATMISAVCAACGARADAEVHVGRGIPRSLEEHLGHLVVVVLPGVDQRGRAPLRWRSAARIGAIFTKLGRAPTMAEIFRGLTPLIASPRSAADRRRGGPRRRERTRSRRADGRACRPCPAMLIEWRSRPSALSARCGGPGSISHGCRYTIAGWRSRRFSRSMAARVRA